MPARSAEAAGSGPPDRVEIQAPARMHITPIDVHGPSDRHSGVGFAVDTPRLHLVLRRAGVFRCLGAGGPQEADRIEREVARAAAVLGCGGGIEVRLVSGVPAHRGFGSGTQLRLSVLRGLAELTGRSLAPQELAALAGRRAARDLGLPAFLHGGLLADGGRHAAVPPGNWGLVLAVPGDAAGSRLTAPGVPLPPSDAQAVRHIVRGGLLPALRDGDLECFGTYLTALQDVGWRRAHWRRTELRHWRLLVDLMCTEGVPGGGLSPTGPLVYGVYDRDAHRGPELTARIAAAAQRAGLRLESLVTTTFGGPAAVETSRGGVRPAATGGQEQAGPGPVR